MSNFRDTCAKLLISYEKQDGRHHCTIDATTKRKTAVAMETIDQLSTYTYVYVNNYQNNIYQKEIMTFSLSRIDFLPINGKSFNFQLTIIYGTIPAKCDYPS